MFVQYILYNKIIFQLNLPDKVKYWDNIVNKEIWEKHKKKGKIYKLKKKQNKGY